MGRRATGGRQGCGRTRRRAGVALGVALLAAAALPPPARAVDGVIEINQARALAGGVTNGDAAGYPITIAESGSYRLTGNLLAVGIAGATPAIEIVADARDVTLDLGGFTLDGGGACTASAPTGASCFLIGGPNGIGSTTNAQIVIRNGTLRGLRGGIVVTSAASVAIEDVLVSEGSSSGITVTSGIPALVRRAVVSITTGRGIDVGSAGTVIDSIADHDGNSGSSAHDNPVGVQLASGASVVSSTIRDNTGFGISAAADATYSGCTLTGNHGGGNNTQVSGGVQIGTSFCGTDTVCP